MHLPVLTLIFPAPNSYTGQDCFELQLPGNPNLVQRIVAGLITHHGLRAAEPGEFTARAYLNRKLTLDQAEGVAATIAAQTSDQLRAAGELLSGHTGARYRLWADEVATLLALTEAGIDFTDQDDVVAIEPATLHQRLGSLLAEITPHAGVARHVSDAPDPVPSVVLVGAPNAGKSTLFNALLDRRRAVVSDLAGTTRDALAEPLDLSREIPGGPSVTLLDLPGLDRGAVGLVNVAAQRAALERVASADVVLWCDPTGQFEHAAARPDFPSTARVIRVRTKADLAHASVRSDPALVTGPHIAPARLVPIAVCALDGYHLPVLRRAIADQAQTARAAGVASLLPRHRRALSQVRDQLQAAQELSINPRPPAELIALRLRAALDHLGELIGHISPDDVIGRVFATFCVGK